MIRDHGAARIAALIRRYKPSTGAATFRNEFRAGILAAVTSNTIGQKEADLLLKARSYLEEWTSDSPPAPPDVWRQWADLYREGKDRLPGSILEALLARFPKSAKEAGEWASLVFGDAEKKLLRLLLTRGLVRKAELIRMAKERPLEFYRSAALDLLLENRTAGPRTVWDSLANGEGRPTGLMTGHEALVTSFDFDGGRDAEQWLLQFVMSAPAEIRKAVLRSLLERAGTSARFANHLIPLHPTRGKSRSNRRSKERPEELSTVLVHWVDICGEALERGDSAAAAASVVLGLIQLGVTANPTMLPSNALARVSAATDRITEQALVLALRSAETAGPDFPRPLALIVRSDELYRAVQEYLRRLPVGVKDDLESPERALRFERYNGRREVVQGLLSALDEVPNNGPMRDAIEAVLFNAGVRPFGVPGEQVAFDTHTHQPEASGLLGGDPAVVTRPGRRLGNEDDGIVIVKARVKPIQR